ncbi:glycerophosphodiester phosphodiesterase [soil metagenome]
MTTLWPWPRVIAHRGGGTLGPENTLAGFEVGRAAGHRAVEFDVMLTRDGVPVVIHDPKLGRTVPGNRPVAEMTAAELVGLDAGSWLGAQFAAARVPLFVDVLAWCRRHDVWMNIEIKPSSVGAAYETGRVVGETTRAFYDGVEAGPALPELSSFSIHALQAARMAAPTFARGLLVTKVPADWSDRLADTGAVALHARHGELDRDLVARVRDAGVPMVAYTVNEPARARELFDWGLDAICTDRIDLIGADFGAAAR